MNEVRQLRAPNPGPFTLDGTNTYIIGRLVIDPGPAIESHIDRILEQAPRVEAILVTHRHADHAPGALSLHAHSNARVYAPRGVLDDGIVTKRLRDGMIIKCGKVRIEAIATPGHTREHYCFLTDNGDLFTGDTVLGEGTTAVFPPDGDMGDYLASLRRLQERNPARIFPGHGPVREDAMELLGQYLEHRMMRDGQISAVLQRGKAMSIDELRSTVYPDLGADLEAAADAQLLAHLLHLIERGIVRQSGERFAAA